MDVGRLYDYRGYVHGSSQQIGTWVAKPVIIAEKKEQQQEVHS